MQFDDYQTETEKTDQNPGSFAENANAPGRPELIPLLGMQGEVGGLIAEYKKFLRDGPRHVRFQEHVEEELGDILWYVANVATKFGLSLDQIATSNLAKVRSRWLPASNYGLFDEDFPPEDQLPRTFEFTLAYKTVEGVEKVVLLDANGEQKGAALTDNARRDDGYRFHDVFHLANAAVLGWSPVCRSLLKCKRKSRPDFDEIEDGGRAAVIEEAIVAAAYEYGTRHDHLVGVERVDWELLRTIHRLASSGGWEIEKRSAADWEKAILAGFSVWRSIVDADGGTIRGDLRQRTIEFVEKGKP